MHPLDIIAKIKESLFIEETRSDNQYRCIKGWSNLVIESVAKEVENDPYRKIKPVGDGNYVLTSYEPCTISLLNDYKNKTNATYKVVRESNDVEYMIYMLQLLCLYCDVQISRPRTEEETKLNEARPSGTFPISRDASVDDWVKDKVIYVAQKAIRDLEMVKSLQLSSIRQSKSKRPIKPQTLFEAWKGGKESYLSIIDKLKESHSLGEKPFITVIDNKLYWQKTDNHISYLAGFVHTLIKKKLVIDEHSAPQWKIILKNTFNISFDSKPFQPAMLMSIDENYTKPFLNIQANLPQSKLP